MTSDKALARAAEYIRQADSIIIAAGAGMSVDSGLPDFRGSNGLWTALLPDGMAERDIGSLTQASCFETRPGDAWTFYGRMLDVCRSATPHEGYALIQAWAADKRHGVFAYTSNVDGHFHAAGFPENRVVECHGTIHTLQCATRCSDSLWPAGELPPDLKTQQSACIHCGKLARPNFLMFSDESWVPQRTAAQQMEFRQWSNEIERPVMIEIGAGLVVPSIRLFAETMGAPLIRINTEDEQIPDGDGVGLRGTALDVLRTIDALLLTDCIP
jgi:NAD-dependent SIR2 family protein deacetylase